MQCTQKDKLTFHPLKDTLPCGGGSIGVVAVFYFCTIPVQARQGSDFLTRLQASKLLHFNDLNENQYHNVDAEKHDTIRIDNNNSIRGSLDPEAIPSSINGTRNNALPNVYSEVIGMDDTMESPLIAGGTTVGVEKNNWSYLLMNSIEIFTAVSAVKRKLHLILIHIILRRFPTF